MKQEEIINIIQEFYSEKLEWKSEFWSEAIFFRKEKFKNEFLAFVPDSYEKEDFYKIYFFKSDCFGNDDKFNDDIEFDINFQIPKLNPNILRTILTANSWAQ